MSQVKLSQLIQLHALAKPLIEKAMLEVIWDDDDEITMRKFAEQVNQWGAGPTVSIHRDVPLGLGDTDALIRFVLSLYQLYEDNPAIQKKNFERLLLQINRDIYLEVWEEFFGDEP